MNYYNEHDPRAAAWLRELIAGGHIPAGIVDERDIREVRAEDLRGFAQCHFFAGIAGWSFALQLAGWPADRPVWTGSCPCQPFSSAGKRLGTKDSRHLWPAFRDLIALARPPVVFGEQVASADGRGWLARVSADLEGMAYTRAGADLCAASVGAPHIRPRLFWVAYAPGDGCRARGREHCGEALSVIEVRPDAQRCSGERDRLGDPNQPGFPERAGDQPVQRNSRCSSAGQASGVSSDFGGLGEPHRPGWEPHRQATETDRYGYPAEPASYWSDFDIVFCTEGKARRIESGTFPLAHGVPVRVGLLRGYGNAIVPQVAAEFIRAAEEAWSEITMT